MADDTSAVPVTPEAKPDHRRRVVLELIATEESYVKSLGVLAEDYYRPLKQMAKDGGPEYFTPAEMETVFKNCDLLFGLNRTLLADLQKAGPLGDIGEVFNRFAPFLKMYRAYLDNSSVAMDVVAQKLKAEASKNELLEIVTKGGAQPKLADFMATKRETLESLMIKPVQRLPRYKMLLEELLKPGCAACVTDAQNNAIRKALEKVSEVAAFCNTSIAKHKEYMEWVAMHLQFGAALPVNRDREILREGTMSKWNRRGQLQRKFVFLFSDALAYGKANQRGGLAKDISAEEVFLFSTAARAVKASATSVTKMVVQSTKKSFVMQLRSTADRDEWVRAINDAVAAFETQLARARARQQQRGGGGGKNTGVLHRMQSRNSGTDGASSGSPGTTGGRAGTGASPGPGSTNASPAGGKGNKATTAAAAKPVALRSAAKTRYAPVWQPDTDNCQLCCKTFSYFRSRHHCRRCGVCMCNTCGNFDCLLKHVDPTRRCRICRVCYMQLRPPGATLSQEDLVMVARCFNVGCLQKEGKDRLLSPTHSTALVAKAQANKATTTPAGKGKGGAGAGDGAADGGGDDGDSAEETAASPMRKAQTPQGKVVDAVKDAGQKVKGLMKGVFDGVAQGLKVPPPLPSRNNKPRRRHGSASGPPLAAAIARSPGTPQPSSTSSSTQSATAAQASAAAKVAPAATAAAVAKKPADVDAGAGAAQPHTPSSLSLSPSQPAVTQKSAPLPRKKAPNASRPSSSAPALPKSRPPPLGGNTNTNSAPPLPSSRPPTAAAAVAGQKEDGPEQPAAGGGGAGIAGGGGGGGSGYVSEFAGLNLGSPDAGAAGADTDSCKGRPKSMTRI